MNEEKKDPPKLDIRFNANVRKELPRVEFTKRKLGSEEEGPKKLFGFDIRIIYSLIALAVIWMFILVIANGVREMRYHELRQIKDKLDE